MWHLYHVKHPIGEFLGFARSMEEARAHWGTRATITEPQSYEDAVDLLLSLRASGKSERIFIAI